MLWLILRTALLYGILMFAAGLAVLIGREQPPDTWANLLNMDTCALPCWIGIEPGKTSINEAHQRIDQIYSDPVKFSLRAMNDRTYEIRLVGKTYTLRPELILSSDGKTVNGVMLYIYTEIRDEQLLIYENPTIAALYAALGPATYSELRRWETIVWGEMVYSDRRMRVSFDPMRCATPRLDDRVIDIALLSDGVPAGGSTPTRAARRFERHLWQGFRTCRPLSIPAFP